MKLVSLKKDNLIVCFYVITAMFFVQKAQAETITGSSLEDFFTRFFEYIGTFTYLIQLFALVAGVAGAVWSLVSLINQLNSPQNPNTAGTVFWAVFGFVVGCVLITVTTYLGVLSKTMEILFKV